jgi:hypothetical protein
MAPKEYLESYFLVSFRIKCLQSSRFIIDAVLQAEEIASGTLGSGVPSAIAGRTSFKHLMQCDTSSSSEGMGMFSIASKNGGTEASTCIIELKKQVLPMFVRVRLKREKPVLLVLSCREGAGDCS